MKQLTGAGTQLGGAFLRPPRPRGGRAQDTWKHAGEPRPQHLSSQINGAQAYGDQKTSLLPFPAEGWGPLTAVTGSAWAVAPAPSPTSAFSPLGGATSQSEPELALQQRAVCYLTVRSSSAWNTKLIGNSVWYKQER